MNNRLKEALDYCKKPEHERKIYQLSYLGGRCISRGFRLSECEKRRCKGCKENKIFY